jgi:hypothetical protein
LIPLTPALEKLKEVTLEESGSTPGTASKGGKSQQSNADESVSGPDELYM